MDRIDLTILSALEEDGRISYSDLGARVGLSRSPCWKRVQSLQENGVISAYRAIVDLVRVGLGIRAFAQVSVKFEQHLEFEAEVLRHPAILSCHTVAGDADYVLEIVTRDIEKLDLLLRKQLSGLPGVERFATTIAMQTIKSHGSVCANLR